MGMLPWAAADDPSPEGGPVDTHVLPQSDLMFRLSQQLLETKLINLYLFVILVHVIHFNHALMEHD